MRMTVQIGHVSLDEEKLNDCLESQKRYIVTKYKVYEIRSVNYKPEYLPYYGSLVYSSQTPIIKRGYEAHTSKEVNELIGYELLAH